MADFVTLEKVKQGLVIDTTDDDARLGLLITAASTSILRYLKEIGSAPFYDWETSALVGDVPEDVQVATIMLVGHIYRSPDSNEDGAFERGSLPKPVTALIYSRRDPALA